MSSESPVSRVVVTGASGCLGRWASHALRERGYEVHCVSRTLGGADDGMQWHATDLLDVSSARRLMSDVRPAALLHLAWETEHGVYWSSPENERWLGATKELVTYPCTPNSTWRRFLSAPALITGFYGYRAQSCISFGSSDARRAYSSHGLHFSSQNI